MKISKPRNIILLVILGLMSLAILSGCGPKGNNANVELIQDMMEVASDKPQEYDDFFKDNPTAARVPPANTVPIGFKPYKWGNDFNLASKENINPMAGNVSEEIISVGKKYYEIHCLLCHGVQGAGDGPVAAKLPLKPPPLVSDKIKSWTDGGIYHVISMGQGVMGPYASHIPQKYRWQVVNYIRQMQK